MSALEPLLSEEAARQGQADDPEVDEPPGRILHEEWDGRA